jgi:hypothetical protein
MAIFSPTAFYFQPPTAAAPPAPGPSVVTNGLIIYMDATDAASYPGTGTSIFNLVAGQVYTGSLVNSPTYKDNYIQLNGTNQYISIPFPGYTSGTATYMGATRYADTSGNGRMFSGGVSGNNWLLGHFQNSTLNYFAAGTITGIPGGPNDTNFRIYTGTSNTTTDRYDFYVNGVNSVTSSAAGSTGLNTPLNVGRQGENNTEYSSGSFAFVLIYNRVLSPAEVTQNYDALKSKVGLT